MKLTDFGDARSGFISAPPAVPCGSLTTTVADDSRKQAMDVLGVAFK